MAKNNFFDKSGLFVVSIKLFIICAVAAICLGAVYGVTKPIIDANQEAALNAGLSMVVTDGEVGEELDITGVDEIETLYEITNNGNRSGYVLRLNATGYGGAMKILASYSISGEVLGIILMENEETPGIGKKAEESGYMNRFIGKGAGEKIPGKKSDLSQQDMDAISGASVTFNGIAKAIVFGSNFVKEQGK